MLQKLLFGLALLTTVAACNQQNKNLDPQQDDDAAVVSSLARLGNPNKATSVTGGPCSETVIAKSAVPSVVFDYLQKTYPGHAFVQAEQGTDRAGKTFYEIQFTLDGKTRELHFDAAGVVLQGPGNGPKGDGGFGPGPNGGGPGRGHKNPPVRTVIAADKLPKPITDYMAANFAGYAIVKVDVVTDPKTGAVLFYDVRYTLNGKTTEAHFDVSGNLQAPPKGGKGPG